MEEKKELEQQAEEVLENMEDVSGGGVISSVMKQTQPCPKCGTTIKKLAPTCYKCGWNRFEGF